MPDFNAKVISSQDSLNNSGNKGWWEDNPMIYDWDGVHGKPEMTTKYFEAVDEIFGEGHSLCNNPRWPKGYILENFLPYTEVQGKKVLEIGCGAGLVSSHLAKAGAEQFSIDLTSKAIEMTKARFGMSNLSGHIQQMDAEKLSFEDNTFDYVISWGVIHHSGNMQAIVNEIHRVLKPGGKAYLMVYNKNSLRYQVYCRIWLGVFRLKLLKNNLDEVAGSITDGFIARHLTEPEFNKMASKFSKVDYSYSDEIGTTSAYLMGPFRHILNVFKFLKKPVEKFLAKKWGWYMEMVLTK